MTAETPSRQSTADTMHDTASRLELSEAALHDAADRSPDPAAAKRLDALGDQVTRLARNIDERVAYLELSAPDSPDGSARDR